MLTVQQNNPTGCIAAIVITNLQPPNSVVTGTITRNGVATPLDPDLYAEVLGSRTQIVNYSYTFSTSNECGTTTVTGSGSIPKCNLYVPAMTVSPNPANTLLDIQIEGEVEKEELENLMIMSNESGLIQNFPSPEKVFQINTANFQNGVYYAVLKLINMEQTVSKKFIVNHGQ